MQHRVSDIAAALGARFEGVGDLTVTAAAEPSVAGPFDLALAMAPRYAEGLSQGRARAAILWEGADWRALGLEAAIFAPRPRLAMAVLTRSFDPGPVLAPGIHPSAVIDTSAQIGPGAAIGPFVVIGADARIGPEARIADHVSIGAGVQIGARALILSGVRIGARVRIGDDFIAQPGCVIGGDGFSFVTEDRSRVEEARQSLGQNAEAAHQAWLRIHSLGAVRIGDNVEVGANSTIDRGTIRDTVIGRGTKIDNLVQVGHNVIVGEDCLLCGQVGIAGSTRIGNHVVLGGQAGVVDNISVGDGVVAAAGTLITSNAPAGRMLMGSPAVRMDQNVEIYKAQRRLPRILAQFAELQKTVKNLVEKGAGGES
ncbi:MAG: UDP-3-O-(3-hydroxymyristoyl)glucosamine N-acyltransferase [Rhodobacter sp.]|uniref:UDP-3-O-(3-hydroxymyristoyl)glucosamine N-acyltransferase n=1 Tax=Pararhodobacter sp. TaxID=2127056 RepID=UPI001DC5E50B|nr:UDP-3-O-(3-hydroxymyristoyl)glucosamine N-acyltransferase [Pararhodobacter sp.]MCB1344303.1 UDP-3-O-(3-hydroxymyristoyl)glucosamine N-acyltransferase [Paracoccaceae bacterium]MCC0073378.1 UDP-3-O-(3-hydroxymyristoyl)glucosamine N-acyltransferase [Rhodobacter sp.]HPD91162.1 UDP-3-O-(3-hydroxymyristoyl)glucosamine N-acyltransferase [Pararhodobacter sp.]